MLLSSSRLIGFGKDSKVEIFWGRFLDVIWVLHGFLKWAVVGCRCQCSDVAVVLELPSAGNVLRCFCRPPAAAAPGAAIAPWHRFFTGCFEMSERFVL